MDLDRPEDFSAVDAADALADVESAAEQWQRAREAAPTQVDLDGLDAIVISGMGGSGICGDIAAALATDRLPVPVVVHKTYGLPSFAGSRTLVIAVSHSGDTEETRSGFDEALTRGSRVLAVSSGGAIARLCRERGLPWVEVAGGGQPRHRLGWLVTPVLAALGLDDGVDEAIALLREVGRDCARAVPLVDNPAKRLASRLAGGGLAALYGAAGLGSVAAYRLKCQLNENAELPALSGELPEMNHNEIVAWPRSKGADVRGVVWIRDPLGEHERVRARFSISQRLVNEHFAWREELVARGTAPLARLASLLGLVDLASVYTAIALDRDPTPIGPIVRLKQELGH